MVSVSSDRRFPVCRTGGFTAQEYSTITFIDEPKVSKYQSDTLDDTLADKITALLKKNPSMTQEVLAEKTKVSIASIKRTMKILSDKEKIVRKGGKRYGYWEIND